MTGAKWTGENVEGIGHSKVECSGFHLEGLKETLKP
jgi:hypothetical protein